MQLRHARLMLLVILLISLLTIYCTNPKEPAAAAVTTIIVVRHAEKDTIGNDPELSVVGKQRAERLPKSFPGITPDAFYSTNYIRTKATLAPWAATGQKTIELYYPSKLPELAEMLRQQKGKTIVVSGHSNTVPPLVNLLISEEKYDNLKDDEYDKIFVVTIKNNNANSTVKTF
jgi:2,3-bisphosphoglycerate-dependent phosphoglycerate mutase